MRFSVVMGINLDDSVRRVRLTLPESSVRFVRRKTPIRIDERFSPSYELIIDFNPAVGRSSLDR
ncbi:MAG: hypothetical protein PVJ32_05745, partial [Anaerolineales bacterium]